ncbi:hypothetical protein D3C86_1932540 [compost metagenome]
MHQRFLLGRHGLLVGFDRGVELVEAPLVFAVPSKLCIQFVGNFIDILCGVLIRSLEDGV